MGQLLARHSLRRAHVAQVSRLCRYRHLDDCIGYRRNHRDFQRGGCNAAAPAAVSASGAARNHPGRSSRRGRARRGNLRAGMARFSAFRHFSICFGARRRGHQSDRRVRACANSPSYNTAELLCAVGRETAVGPLIRSRGSDSRIQPGSSHQRRIVEAGLRKRSAYSGQKCAAGQRFVSRGRRHAAGFSRSGSNSRGKQH